MLHVVRRHKNSKVIWVILGLVVFVFVFWGVDAVVSGPPVNAVAMVGDTPIEPLEVRRAELNLVQMYRNAYKERFTPEVRKSLNLRQQALEGLIDRALLVERARDLGIVIGDAELRDVIIGNPMFQRDGRFNKSSYLRALRYSRLTPADYEEGKRRDLAVERLQHVVEDGVTVSDAAVRDAVLADMETRTFTYVKLPTSEFEADVAIDDEAAMQETYEKFKEKYKKPETVRASFLVFSPDQFSSDIEVSDEDVAAFYEEKKATRFTQPHEVSARHILIKVDAGADDQTKAEARRRIEEVQKKLAAGEDFAALAKEYSEDPGSAAKGGELGYFGKGRMVPTFEEAAFALAPGQTSEIVESPFGFHLIRVDDVREERTKPLDEVRDEIVAELRRDRGGEKAKEAAEAAHGSLAAGKSLEEVAKEDSLTVVTPEPFAKNAPIPGVGRAYPLTTALFGLEAGKYTEVVAVDKSWAIGRLDEKIPETIPPLEEVRSLVLGDLRRTEGEKKGQAAAAELLAKAKEVGSLEKAAEAAGRTVETSQSFSQQGPYVPGMGMNQKLKDAVFALSEEKPVADETFTVLGDAVVVGLGEVKTPTEEELQEKMEQARKVLVEEAQQRLFRRYVDEIKAETRVEINTQILDQLPPV